MDTVCGFGLPLGKIQTNGCEFLGPLSLLGMENWAYDERLRVWCWVLGEVVMERDLCFSQVEMEEFCTRHEGKSFLMEMLR